ncbi:hypothetical protein L3Q72_19900 [Vibrio sp. JC009]|uniref:hypothetical protein n=1 Tax=Vibrio sp. JC009 TaxID=2912314 RepID=UPI0023B1AC78|nr:hypothetical protein [Vibrio sp. JC009]WED23506.1 hypothetical protein L3Q72_19900 [Vibrio sp. JC009]
MSAQDIARIDATMSNLVELTREQNTTLKEMVKIQAETREAQKSHSKRIDRLEADKTWLVRTIFAIILAGLAAAYKVM